jgi:oligopeptidase B
MLSTTACRQEPAATPPAAKKVPHKFEKFGHVRVDDYYWMHQRDNPEVKAYLEAENAYAETMMAPLKGFQETLFNEFKTRIKQTDTTAPYLRDGYYYYTRTEQDRQYPIHCRKQGSLEAAEQVVLDVNEIAKGFKYLSATMPQPSPDGKLAAYGVDTAGRRFYTWRFREIATGKPLPDTLKDITGNLTWANDNQTVFYAKQDPVTLRYFRIYRHRLGTDPARDEMVFEEKDSTFNCHVTRSKSKKFLFIVSSQTLSSEYRYLDASTPQGRFQVFLPRQRDHEYGIDHHGDTFYIRTNREAKNFRLMKTRVGRNAVSNWQEVLPHRPDVLLEDIEVFSGHLAAVERKGGLMQIHVVPYSGQAGHYLDFGEPAYLAEPTNNFEPLTPWLRYTYTSLTTPASVYDYNMETKEKKLVKRQEVLGGFEQTAYQTERIEATAPDGVKVPISLVYRKDRRKPGANPLLLYGYGSYGNSMDAAFNPFAVSLLDRGFVYAIAHVRGGQELGRAWYEDGKLLKKKNTFTDFIACAEHLIAQKYADPKRVFANGGSAGGLLMGAVVNLRPDLWRGIVADVPWVDVVTGMLDDTIPLTTGEYDEWGNPNQKEYYDYMLSYSPYDQAKKGAYPHMLVMTSFQDSQVQYWDPAKWVAKLRTLKTDGNRLLLRTEMEASHGGLSARDDRYRQTAYRYAFLLDLAGLRQ